MATAIVTGASSGIGLEMAMELDAAGYHVVLVARSRDALDALAKTLNSSQVVVADLSLPDGPSLVAAAVESVDILVNNAGFGDVGPFAQSDPDFVLSMIQVNCAALTQLTRIYLPGMVARGQGKILNIASAAAFQAGPNMAVYFATKAYVLSFTEAIAEEVRRSGVTATAFCPGAFASGFQEVARAENIRLNKGRTLPTSRDMAKEAIKAMNRGDVVYIPGLANKIGAAGTRFVPRALLRRIVSRVNNVG
jgi:hypothetical protein